MIYKFNPTILNPLLILRSGKYVYTELSFGKSWYREKICIFNADNVFNYAQTRTIGTDIWQRLPMSELYLTVHRL